MVAVLTLVIVASSIVAVNYRRQLWSVLTHWKGSPTDTVAYTALPEPAVLHVAVAGDVGDSGRRLDATASAVDALGRAYQRYDVLLLLGDNVYPDGDPALLGETVFRPFAAVIEDQAELLAILGNHDVQAGHGDAQMAALGMPGRWWSRSLADGDVLMVGIDSNSVDDVEQRAWLDRTLDASDATWKIVALHHPPYSAGYQGSSIDARKAFSPIFEEHGVQLVLSGHDHDYQRSTPQNGVTYVVSGAAAGTRRTGERSFTAMSFSWHHFVDISVFEDRLVLRAMNQDLRVADEVTIRP
jgi:3',5'-cyclic AMP phosphodiesterase CpdA